MMGVPGSYASHISLFQQSAEDGVACRRGFTYQLFLAVCKLTHDKSSTNHLGLPLFNLDQPSSWVLGIAVYPHDSRW